jgi:eukaryotic-like serine/threonine-protein kinase
MVQENNASHNHPTEKQLDQLDQSHPVSAATPPVSTSQEMEQDPTHKTPHTRWLLAGLSLLVLVGIGIITKGFGLYPILFPSTITRVSDKDGMVQVYVPEGNFRMGALDSDLNAEEDAKPQHTVWLDAFWIDRTEVTNAQYQQCVKAGACTAPLFNQSASHSSYYDSPDYADYPVIAVDWNQASAYCAWAGRLLPTEAQWEKAARGKDGKTYAWGDQSPNNELSNFFNAVGDTTKIGSYPQGASPYGALDMSGNVWEWVNDWYLKAYYSTSPDRNPTGPASGDMKVVRGGAWISNGRNIRSSYRYGVTPDNSGDYFLGFRCLASN